MQQGNGILVEVGKGDNAFKAAFGQSIECYHEAIVVQTFSAFFKLRVAISHPYVSV